MADPADYFLKVARSVSGKAWVDRLDAIQSRAAAAIGQQGAISEILARIIAGRGVAPEEAQAFLSPTIRELMPDPSSLTDLDKAAARLADAIERSETIALFGDYDVDGASSVSLMVRYLGHFGLTPIVHIPDRIFEGYGPNIPAMDSFKAAGASLILTLDCGTSSLLPIAHAKGFGADILVIDHHLSDHELPVADALVNPNRADDVSGLGYLAAAGVVFMVLVGVNRVLRSRGRSDLPDLMGLADLVSLATICDVVPLIGLNRAFVVRGLETMRAGSNPGITALALAARVNGPLNPYHLGYLIGPRINAGGRIGDAALGAKLLATDDQHESLVIAAQLDELNSERQRIEGAAVEQAIAAAEAEIGTGEGPAVLVLASEDWHPGIVGLIAARLKERFERPAFAIALARNGEGRGSGRSVPGVDLGRAIIEAVDRGLIEKGGGHAMAAGISLSRAQIGGLRAYLDAAASEAVTKSRTVRQLSIDAALTAGAAKAELVNSLEKAGPFGAGNPSPVFAFPAHRANYADIVGSGGHVRFTLMSGDGAKLKGIAFRAAETPVGQALLNGGSDKALHFAGTLGIDHWQGREQVQIRLIDLADPDKNAG